MHIKTVTHGRGLRKGPLIITAAYIYILLQTHVPSLLYVFFRNLPVRSLLTSRQLSPKSTSTLPRCPTALSTPPLLMAMPQTSAGPGASGASRCTPVRTKPLPGPQRSTAPIPGTRHAPGSKTCNRWARDRSRLNTSGSTKTRTISR